MGVVTSIDIWNHHHYYHYGRKDAAEEHEAFTELDLRWAVLLCQNWNFEEWYSTLENFNFLDNFFLLMLKESIF